MLAFYVDREVGARKAWELGGNRYTKTSRSLDSLSRCMPHTTGLESSPSSPSRLRLQAFNCLPTAVNAWLER